MTGAGRRAPLRRRRGSVTAAPRPSVAAVACPIARQRSHAVRCARTVGALPAHVENVGADWVRSWAFASLAVGALLVVSQRVLDRRTPRRLVTVWLSLALSLGAAWLGILGLQAVSGGQAPPREWEPGVFGVAAVAGVAAGALRHRRASAKTARPSADG